MRLAKLSVAAAALAATVLACVGSFSAGAGAGAPLPPNRPQATQIDSRLLAHFALLRKPRTAQDAIPPAVFTPPSIIDLLYGVNPALSRRAAGPSTGTVPLAGVWLAAANNALCVYLPQHDNPGRVASSCIRSIKRAITIGDAGTLGGFGGLHGLLTLVHGVMPDDVKHVRIRRRTGTTVTVPVRHNVFAKAMTRPNRVFYAIAGEHRSLRLLAPCDHGPGVC
jgi:hypothetical protein